MEENKKIYDENIKRFKVIGYGTYKDVKWAIVSIRGEHPCAYIENKLERECSSNCDIDNVINVHGGVTFWDYCYFNPEDEDVIYIGWDYAHYNDYIYYHNMPEDLRKRIEYNSGKKWTYDEIKEQVLKAIDDMLEDNYTYLEEKRKIEVKEQ